MSLTLGSSVLLLILLLVAAGAFAAWSYFRTTPPIPTPMRSLLGGLRFASIALILFLLFDPSIRRSFTQEHAPELLFLIDNSASVPFVEGEDAGERLREALRTLSREAQTMPSTKFDGSGRSIGALDSGLDSLTFDGPRTNIAAGIDHIRARPDSRARAVVLISDGRYNSGRNPVFAADESSIPIHAIVVGDTSRFEDVIMREVVTNEIAYTGTELPIRARILSEGFAGEGVTVSVFDGGTRLASEPLQLRGDGTEQTVDLYVTPDEPGLKRYTVTVTHLEGEATHRNNSRAVTVRVVDSRRSVLMIGGAPDPDIGAIRQALTREGDMEVTTRIQRDPSSFYEGALPSDISDYDLIVLAGFPAPQTARTLIENVAVAISGANSPVLYLAGRRVDANAVSLLGERVLPALPRSAASGDGEVLAAITSSGRSHPVTGAVAAETAVWGNLPPLIHSSIEWQPSPDASVLLNARGRLLPENAPLLVARSRPGSRSAALLAANSWRWRTVSPSITGAEELFDRLVDNLVQWLTSPEDDRLVRVRPAQDLFEGTESVRLLGEVYDERLVPVEDADVEVEIMPDDGAPFRLSMIREGSGRYRLDAGNLSEGTYTYRASARHGDVDLGMDTGVFTVGALEIEYMHTRADAALMRQIAARSGGQFGTLSDLPNIIDAAFSDPTFTPEREHITRESSLRHTYLLLLLVIAFLAAEWVLRKRSGMV